MQVEGRLRIKPTCAFCSRSSARALCQVLVTPLAFIYPAWTSFGLDGKSLSPGVAAVIPIALMELEPGASLARFRPGFVLLLLCSAVQLCCAVLCRKAGGRRRHTSPPKLGAIIYKRLLTALQQRTTKATEQSTPAHSTASKVLPSTQIQFSSTHTRFTRKKSVSRCRFRFIPIMSREEKSLRPHKETDSEGKPASSGSHL